MVSEIRFIWELVFCVDWIRRVVSVHYLLYGRVELIVYTICSSVGLVRGTRSTALSPRC